MLITFKTKSASSVMMFVEHALPLFTAGGRVFPEGFPKRGVITAEQLSTMIHGIEQEIEAKEQHENSYHEEDDDDNDDKLHPMTRPVSLRQRAYPLLELLRKAEKEQHDVLWEETDTSW
ncbi:DUF1840 domain-containing protein [Alcaligenes endophyticus]|uniref:DUF1840 domain-containing protein n=1 Tax=Alcaligenes endophyticus TaxID=1929088 RepID=A0ABT8EF45_9BURK|nr:DUF1840 domain-containing protein [Alcaligenes endophyticus]MCX5590433.1 DUF1840 domain-containing protein [Alcaligenes endophyticus]MDN4119903.1 DUF1840 domain-containing protein [Alcaligenes endophyticus]